MEPRAYEAGAAGTPPPLLPTAVMGFPQTASPTQNATTPGPRWFFMVGEEVRNAIIGSGMAPDPYDSTQLLQAIQRLNASGD